MSLDEQQGVRKDPPVSGPSGYPGITAPADGLFVGNVSAGRLGQASTSVAVVIRDLALLEESLFDRFHRSGGRDDCGLLVSHVNHLLSLRNVVFS